MPLFARLSRHLPATLLVLYSIFFIALGITPFRREVWYAENIPIVAIVLALTFLYWRGIRFSNTAYLLMSVLVFMHTIGGHYTFERVPFDLFQTFFGFERNMYDRVAHFSVGLYAFAFTEFLFRSRSVSNRSALFFFPLFAIAFVAMGYEIIEWLFVVASDPAAGTAFLGSQGDVWDAQKDMLSDTLGALFALGLFFFVRRPEFSKSSV
ncbi:MAG: DUF2238 domain-containing protein [Candidatus Moraniibacteriota bacterium]